MTDKLNKTETEKPASALTTAAEAIGSTLGKVAVKTGLAKTTPPAAKKRASKKGRESRRACEEQDATKAVGEDRKRR